MQVEYTKTDLIGLKENAIIRGQVGPHVVTLSLRPDKLLSRRRKHERVPNKVFSENIASRAHALLFPKVAYFQGP